MGKKKGFRRLSIGTQMFIVAAIFGTVVITYAIILNVLGIPW